MLLFTHQYTLVMCVHDSTTCMTLSLCQQDFFQDNGLLTRFHAVARPKFILKLKSRKISFIHKISYCCPITSKLCTDHGNITAMLCAKFQNDWTTETVFMEDRDFKFKTDFGRLCLLVRAPGLNKLRILIKRSSNVD